MHMLRSQDSDLMIEEPSNPLEFVDQLSTVLNDISDCDVQYLPERNLVQVQRGRAHGDIWFYHQSEAKDARGRAHKVLINDDYTVPDAQRTISYEFVFPSKYVNWKGISVPLPNRPQETARHLFGDRYITEKFDRMQCLENIVTLKISPVRMALYVFALLVCNLLSMTIRRRATADKECEGCCRRNVHSVIIATLPTSIIDSALRTFNANPMHVEADVDEQEALLVSQERRCSDDDI